MTLCSVCKRKIRGGVRNWNHRPFCIKCYQYFTRRVRIRRKLQERPRSFLGWLLGSCIRSRTGGTRAISVESLGIAESMGQK
jgi:hypothetical protein